MGSEYGICDILDCLFTLPFEKVVITDINSKNLLINDHDYIIIAYELSPYIEDVSMYIARFVARKLCAKINCNFCTKI